MTWPDAERTDSIVIAYAAGPAAAPAFAERVTVAAAGASADTAVIGGQPAEGERGRGPPSRR